MTLDLLALVTDVVDALRAGGVRATLDPREVNPPCVLVMPPVITWRMKGADATFTLYALAGDTGASTALGALGPLIDATRAALGGAVAVGTPVDVSTVDAGALPGYSLTFSTKCYPT